MLSIVAASSPLPLDYPFRVYRHIDTSAAGILQRMNRLDEIADELAKKYDLENWIAINQLVKVDLSEWLGEDRWRQRFGLDEAMKRAIGRIVDKIIRQRENVTLENQRKLEEMIQANKKLTFPAEVGSSVSRYLH